MGHIDDRIYSYVYDKVGFEKKLNTLFKQIGLDAGLASETPIFSSMDQ